MHKIVQTLKNVTSFRPIERLDDTGKLKMASRTIKKLLFAVNKRGRESVSLKVFIPY